MIGLLVTGHANFGTGITSSVNLIAGEQEAYKAVDFLPTYSTEDLTREITKALDELKDCEGVIIFTDLMGGTPFNVFCPDRTWKGKYPHRCRHEPSYAGRDRDVT